jgi:hypothetical protein
MLRIKGDEIGWTCGTYGREHEFNLKVHYRVHKVKSLVPILSHFNPFYSTIYLRSILINKQKIKVKSD